MYSPENDGVLALAVEFAPMADSHLVAVEHEEGCIQSRIFNGYGAEKVGNSNSSSKTGSKCSRN